MVRIIVNEFSGAHIYITADHGFLYTYQPLAEDSKVDSKEWKDQAADYGRRYAILNKGVEPEYLQPIRFLDGSTSYDAFAPKESIRTLYKSIRPVDVFFSITTFGLLFTIQSCTWR